MYMMLTDSRNTPSIEAPAYLTISGAARYLGVARSTVYRLIGDGKLDVYRVTPDAPRLKRGDLDAYAEGNRESR